MNFTTVIIDDEDEKVGPNSALDDVGDDVGDEEEEVSSSSSVTEVSGTGQDTGADS